MTDALAPPFSLLGRSTKDPGLRAFITGAPSDRFQGQDGRTYFYWSDGARGVDLCFDLDRDALAHVCVTLIAHDANEPGRNASGVWAGPVPAVPDRAPDHVGPSEEDHATWCNGYRVGDQWLGVHYSPAGMAAIEYGVPFGLTAYWEGKL